MMRIDEFLLRPARAVIAASSDDDTDRLETAILWLRCSVLDFDLADARAQLAHNEYGIQNLQETINEQALALARAETKVREQSDTLSRYEGPLELAAELLGVGPLDQVPEAIRGLQAEAVGYQTLVEQAVEALGVVPAELTSAIERLQRAEELNGVLLDDGPLELLARLEDAQAPAIAPDPLVGAAAWLGGLKPMRDAGEPKPKKLVVCPFCHGEKAPQHPSRCALNPHRIVSGIARTNGHAAEPLAEVAADTDPT